MNEQTFHTWMNVSTTANRAAMQIGVPIKAAVAGSLLLPPPPPTPARSPDLCRVQMARLLAISHGEGVLSRERWAAMRSLEERRRQRLAAGGASA